ncbi:MAG: polysaccharide deacetylase family protein [Promethearchaeia archaeon]
MSVKIIIRVDDISDGYDLMELKSWFISHFPTIPVCFYIFQTHRSFMWKLSDWKTIKNLIEKYGWEVGGHSRNHKILTTLNENQLEYEITGNIRDIEINLRKVDLNYKVTSFAYPFGKLNNKVKTFLKKNSIKYGLTYTNSSDYKPQFFIPENNPYEINISCNFTNSIEDWNHKFDEVYNKNGVYILCLHTSHWSNGLKKKWLKKIMHSKSIKGFYYYSIRLIKNIIRKKALYNWNFLKQHLDYILEHPNIEFTTFKRI